jgi:Ca2+-binding RTX toxin-like protein
MTADGSKYIDRIEVATNASDAVVGSLQGGFVVAWDDLGDTGTTPSIMGRLYDRGGGSLVDIQISSPETSSDTDPSLAISGSANFIVTWTREETGRDVYARVFADDGQPLGQEFAITATGTVLGRSAVTALASGAFFVAWEDSEHNDPADTSGTHISGRMVHADGTADAPFVVNTTSSGDQSDLAIVSLSTGGFLVVWLDGSDDPSSLIRARAFDANGNPLAQDFVVARSDTDALQDLAAASLPDGQFVVSWTDSNAATSTSDIHARIMSADGSAVSDPFVVNYATAGQGNEGHSSITVLADGRIMVTWADGDAAGSPIRAQIFDQRDAGVTLASTDDNGDWVGTAFGDSFFPGSGVNHIVGGAGDDYYYLSGSNDTIIERAGQGDHDRILVSFDYQMPALAQVEELTTTDSAGTASLHLTGNEFANSITGNAGDNWLNIGGSAGPADTLVGLGGDDWYFVYRSSDVVIEALGGGNDRVFAAVDYTLAAGQSIETLSTTDNGGTAPLHLTGNEFANTIGGNAGDNVLDGGSLGPADTLIGFGGDDTYLVHRSTDVVVEDPGAGNDTIRTDVSYALAPGQEIEALLASDAAGTAPLVLTGNAFGNTIGGNVGAANTLVGEGGDDTYLVRNSTDVVIEAPGGGADTVRTDVSYTLAPGQEIEALLASDNAGTAPLVLTGNAFGNTIGGNAGAANTLIGLGGNDTYLVRNSTDTVIEALGGGIDTVRTAVSYTLATGQEIEALSADDNAGTAPLHLTGNELANTITGNAGDNWFNYGGVTGPADTLIGLAGDDWYFVYRSNEVVAEAAAGGNDRVFAAVDYTLAAGQQIETLSTTDNGGTAPLHLTGNEFANTIAGNAGNNVLDGDSSGAADTLIGMAGDDTYLVHHSGDAVIEAAGGGTDTVRSDVNFALTAGQEIETLSASDNASTTPLHLTGNEFANTITGNAGDNWLDGSANSTSGNPRDTLIGGRGNDWYFVHNAADNITELAGQGTLDRVFASTSYNLAAGTDIEILSTANHVGTEVINLRGNELAQTVVGNVGSNIISGGGGNDTLTGLGGNDYFLFEAAPGPGNVDRITDFTIGQDHILMLQSAFNSLSAGTLSNSNFMVRGTAFQDANDFIFYDPNNGALYYDADGSGTGAAQQFATVTPNLNLHASDFIIV